MTMAFAIEVLFPFLVLLNNSINRGICVVFISDLKPENILLSFDENLEKCLELKLCDFGLCSKFKSKEPLVDFCGSPGS